MEEKNKDDGSLAFLKIAPDKNNRRFNCEETTQQKLINREFYVIDYIDDITTKFGNDRFLVKIKFNLNDDESASRKFFTNSTEIKHVLGQVKEMNAFPRKVTMRAAGTRYYLE